MIIFTIDREIVASITAERLLDILVFRPKPGTTVAVTCAMPNNEIREEFTIEEENLFD